MADSGRIVCKYADDPVGISKAWTALLRPAKPLIAIWRGVGDRGRARHQVRHEMAGTWADAEAVPREAARDVEAGDGRDLGDDRNAVGRCVDHDSPALCDLHTAERREAPHEVPFPFIENGERWRGIERAHRLERRPRVERPAPRDPPLLEKAPADAQAQFVPLSDEGREEIEEQPEAVRRELGDIGVPPRDRVAAIEPLAEGEIVGAGGASWGALDRTRAHRRGEQLELRQLHAEIAAEEPRPGAPCEHHLAAADRPSLSDHAAHRACGCLDAPHGASLEDRSALAEGGIGDCRRGLLWLGAAVARRIERRRPAPRGAWQEPVDLVRSDEAGVNLVRLSLAEPGLVLCRLSRRLAEIDDASLAKPGLGVGARIHALPQPHRLNGEWDFGEIAPHLAAPAPIAARLLAGDPPFLAQDDRRASLGEEERG